MGSGTREKLQSDILSCFWRLLRDNTSSLFVSLKWWDKSSWLTHHSHWRQCVICIISYSSRNKKMHANINGFKECVVTFLALERRNLSGSERLHQLRQQSYDNLPAQLCWLTSWASNTPVHHFHGGLNKFFYSKCNETLNKQTKWACFSLKEAKINPFMMLFRQWGHANEFLEFAFRSNQRELRCSLMLFVDCGDEASEDAPSPELKVSEPTEGWWKQPSWRIQEKSVLWMRAPVWFACSEKREGINTPGYSDSTAFELHSEFYLKIVGCR